MEEFLAQCSRWISGNTSMWVSVLLAGLIGSVMHCSFMCSPLVAAQMFELKSKHRQSWMIAWYHAGRITTYAALGIVAFIASHLVFRSGIPQISKIAIFLAGTLFILSALSPKKTHKCCGSRQQRLPRWLYGAPMYFVRGLAMGFMPCGMLVSVLLLVSTTSSAAMAATLMVVFGVSTLPVLQSAGLGALFIQKRFPSVGAQLGRTVMAVNGCFLCAIGLGAISLH